MTKGSRRIGIITGAQGLQGHLRLKPYNANPDWLEGLDEVILFASEEESTPLGWRKVLEHRMMEHMVILLLDGITSRTEAEQYVGQCLGLYQHQLPELQAGEYYLDSLPGLIVMSADSQRELGVVNAVLSASAGEFLEVSPANPLMKETVLVPFRAPFIGDIVQDKQQLFIHGLDTMFEVQVSKAPS